MKVSKTFIYLKPEDWAKKQQRKADHKVCIAKGFISGIADEVLFVLGHGSPNGYIEVDPGKFIDHANLAAYYQRRAEQRGVQPGDYHRIIVTHGCYDGVRPEVTTANYTVRSATGVKTCTITFVADFDAPEHPGYVKIAFEICD